MRQRIDLVNVSKFVIFVVLLCGLFTTASFTPAFSDVIFSDDFNDNFIDTSKWMNPDGYRVAEEDGILKVETNVTDRGGSIYSKEINLLNNTDSIIISKKTQVHFANSYYQGGTGIYFGPATGPTPPVYFGAIYDNYFDTSPPKVGFYVIDWAHPDPETDTYGNIGQATQPIWNEWFDETIVYAPTSGQVQYYINDQLRIERNVGALPCIFHTKPASDSTRSRPPIPFHSGH